MSVQGDRFEPIRDLIWETIERNRWSITGLAKRAGLTRSGLSNVLNYVVNPSLDFLDKIARALGLPIEYLLSLAGYMPPEPPARVREKELLYHFRQLSTPAQDAIMIAAAALPHRSWAAQALGQLDAGQLAQVRAYIECLKAR